MCWMPTPTSPPRCPPAPAQDAQTRLGDCLKQHFLEKDPPQLTIKTTEIKEKCGEQVGVAWGAREVHEGRIGRGSSWWQVRGQVVRLYSSGAERGAHKGCTRDEDGRGELRESIKLRFTLHALEKEPPQPTFRSCCKIKRVRAPGGRQAGVGLRFALS